MSWLMMSWLKALVAKFTATPEWREIATAPLHRELELAVIGDEISVLGFSCLRCADGWLDAETLRPVAVTATHWRYRQPAVLPFCCC
ncbi:hypothetical protein [Bradyrhizobium sp. NP1]|uniref:hypothetical protein n=1 Tax=Bradyrhizobium sp. NP1 TaxID=3049772 RepID=UPI0025A5B8C6|nr:hypothetical protein [Bradyrhizobium sp. NP1]WJR80199.1 hypothetical protein QOU61_10700 [Bradyrhizobium sp. NP1]